MENRMARINRNSQQSFGRNGGMDIRIRKIIFTILTKKKKKKTIV